MPTAHRCLAFLALIALPSCAGDLTAPSGSNLALAVQGQWAEEQTIAGNFLAFTLQATDTTLTGAGTFVGEAGPGGTVAVVGVVAQSTITMRFTYTTTTAPTPVTFVARFTGTLDANNRMVGSIRYGPESGQQPEYPTAFRRPRQLSL